MIYTSQTFLKHSRKEYSNQQDDEVDNQTEFGKF